MHILRLGSAAAVRQYQQSYYPGKRFGALADWDGNRLFAYVHNRLNAIQVSHKKPRREDIIELADVQETQLVRITRQHVLESPQGKQIKDLEERIEIIARDAEPLRGTESYDVLVSAMGNLKAERDERAPAEAVNGAVWCGNEQS